MSTTPFVFTVKQLTRYIRVLLEKDRALQSVWVRGEISDFTLHSSGHLYFTLKDEGSRLRCALFRNEARRLAFRPAEGMTVLACGRITVYEPSGQYQMVVEELSAEGVGALFLAFEALKKKLAAEGLFDEARKRPLPPFPKRIAILTSPDGAVFHDIVSVIHRRWPGVNLLLIPTPVQGATAPAGIVHSFELLAALPDMDFAILARGGGSPEELAVFNDEAVARAIVACPVPVVSAIGHEVDFTIADFVADLRAPTPSVAGELVVPDRAQMVAHVGHLETRGSMSLGRRLETARRELTLLTMRRPFSDPTEMITTRAQQVDVLFEDLKDAAARRVETSAQHLKQVHASLEALSPLAVLKRGYAVVRKLPEEKVVRSVKQLSSRDRAKLIFADGAVTAEIAEVEPTEHPK